MTLRNLERDIANLEEALNAESEKNILQDLKNYNSLTLLQGASNQNTNKPLSLMPLREVKIRADNNGKRVQDSKSTKKSSGTRHSFYPNWSHGLKKVTEFAAKMDFKSIVIEPKDHYSTVSVFWRQRELVVNCDRLGLINEIRHRSTRWLSSTFKCFDDKGDDVRCYLETRTPLDDDESCLETVIEFLNGRSIFTETFKQQIEQNQDVEDKDPQPYSSKPLIAEMFHLNWTFRSMRRITPVFKFFNQHKDLLVLHKIQDGYFRSETREFEWLPKHYEFEIKMSMENRSTEQLSRVSYGMCLKILDFTKSNQMQQ